MSDNTYLLPNFFLTKSEIHPFNAKNCFQHVMGHVPKHSDKTTRFVYEFFLSAENKQIASSVSVNKKIKSLNPKNKQLIFTLAHDLALQNQQPEKALVLRGKLAWFK